jgi:hypothetical protein
MSADHGGVGAKEPLVAAHGGGRLLISVASPKGVACSGCHVPDGENVAGGRVAIAGECHLAQESPEPAGETGATDLRLRALGSHGDSFTRTPFVKSRKDRFRNITESI